MYEALLYAAVLFAAHAPRDERLDAVAVSLVLVINWYVCGATYGPNPPHRALGVTAPDFWSVADALLAAVAITVSRRWWGWTIWAACTCQVCFHIFHGSLPDKDYTFWLDRLLDAQLACFIMLGGRGVLDRVKTRLLGLCRFRRLGMGAKRFLAKVNRP